MVINSILVGLFLAFVLALVVIEAATVVLKVPTISERMQRLANSARIVIVLTSVVIGYLLAHFFEGGCF